MAIWDKTWKTVHALFHVMHYECMFYQRNMLQECKTMKLQYVQTIVDSWMYFILELKYH